MHIFESRGQGLGFYSWGKKNISLFPFKTLLVQSGVGTFGSETISKQ